MLDSVEDVKIELEMTIKSTQKTTEGEDSITYKCEDLSFVLEQKDISDISTTSSTFAPKDSRQPSIDMFNEMLMH
jgi:membrane-bound inhibitor of C-type lysozyme